MIFLKLFLTFFKIGLFTIGGGYAMLPLIQDEVVNNGWMPEEQIVNFIAVSESTPGPFAINISTYIGSTMGGEFGLIGSLLGAFCATMGVVLPSFTIILIVARIYEQFKTNKVIAGCMTGLKPAVIGLIGSAVLTIIVTVFVPSRVLSFEIFKTAQTYVSLGIFALCTVLVFKKVHPIIIICLSAVLGIVAGYFL
ncbi:MAG: chromate transporter [Clostridia bacterium]|nr:chromate transporter [Clostridia bacterium]